jgi:hypothetical protein
MHEAALGAEPSLPGFKARRPRPVVSWVGMTVEARVAFLAFFFLLWALLGLLPWLGAALWRRGRGVILALPLAPLAGCLAGALVPVLGADDGRGFLLSLATAFAGGALGTATGVLLEGRLARPGH